MLVILRYKCRVYKTERFALHEVKKGELYSSMIDIDRHFLNKTVNRLASCNKQFIVLNVQKKSDLYMNVNELTQFTTI